LSGVWKILCLFALWIISLGILAVILLALGWFGIVVLIGLTIVYCWMAYVYLYYRHCRREELLHLLAGAAEDGVPLAPAVLAHVSDRPTGPIRRFWLACMLCVFPVPGYYWIWYRQNSFDRKIAQLGQLLEQGMALSQALQLIPALASHETILAAAVGETSGQLARCLRGTAQRRISALWIDFAPQLLYPLVLMLVISAVFSFIVFSIVPKFKLIARDFGVALPPQTLAVLQKWDLISQYWYIVLFGAQLMVVTLLILVFSTTARWFFPVVSMFYRRSVRSRVLRILGLLLGTGTPLPQSMAVLSRLPLGKAVLMRLDEARHLIEDGSAFGDSLCVVGLLPPRMLPLVHAAERAGNLPWALTEMAELLYNRTMRLTRRLMEFVFPAVVVALGVLVAVVVVALFAPVVSITSQLAQ
jgi:protein transport protein HofC